MSKKAYKVSGVLGVMNLLKAVCGSHTGVVDVKSGINFSDHKNNSYPMAFLESDPISSVSGGEEEFQIALSVADKMPKDATEEEYLLCISKVEQILSELHYELTSFSANISAGSTLIKTPYRDRETDRLAVMRGEFTFTIPRLTAKKETPIDKAKLQVYLETLEQQG